jgi:hypothetical protein
VVIFLSLELVTVFQEKIKMPRGELQAYAIKRPAFVFGIEDLMMVKGSPSMRLTATPFVHDYENKVFLGGAVGWKGVRGIEKVKAINPAVGEGLERAIGISKECAGEKGSVRIGDRYLPKKDICEINHGKKAA